MKNIIRTLDYYGYDYDSTMYENDPYEVSKVKEIKNMKYIKKND